LLIVLAVVALLLIIVIPVLPFTKDNESIDTLMQPLMCQPGERVIREQYTTTDSEGTGYSMNVYCMGRDEVRQDVTGRWVIMGIVAFVVPLLLGVLVINLGARRVAKASSSAFANTSSYSFPSVSSAAMTAGVNGGEPPDDDDKSLTERLEELEQARSMALITEDEYQRLRKAVLDEGV
jgi:hypothetical protein